VPECGECFSCSIAAEWPREAGPFNDERQGECALLTNTERVRVTAVLPALTQPQQAGVETCRQAGASERMDPTLDPAPKRRLLLRKRERREFYSVVLGLDADQDVLPAGFFRLSNRVVNIGR
jgi:hypothetical protein